MIDPCWVKLLYLYFKECRFFIPREAKPAVVAGAVVASGILNGMSNDPANTVQTRDGTIHQSGASVTSQIANSASRATKAVGGAIQSAGAKAMSVAMASPVVTGVAVLASVIVLTAIGLGVSSITSNPPFLASGSNHFGKHTLDYCFIISSIN